MDEDEDSASDNEEDPLPAESILDVQADNTSLHAASSTNASSNKDVAKKEQELVNWALNEYIHTKQDQPSAGDATKENDGEAVEIAIQEAGRSKRQREDDEPKVMDKRQKSIEPQVAAEDSDDDEFVVPEIVMGESDDEDDE